MTDILEPILFKHYKPLKEKNNRTIKQSVYHQAEQFLRECFTIPEIIEKQYTLLGQQIATRPVLIFYDTPWITCDYRRRQWFSDTHRMESYCHHPEHPAQSILWNPVCMKNECELNKHDLFIE